MPRRACAGGDAEAGPGISPVPTTSPTFCCSGRGMPALHSKQASSRAFVGHAPTDVALPFAHDDSF